MAKMSKALGVLGVLFASMVGCSKERPAGAADSRAATMSTSADSARTSSLAASANKGVAAPAASTAPDSGDAQWTIPAKNYASTRYSGLSQITAANVSGLKLAWSFSTGVNRGHEAAPLVVGHTMYIVTPYPNILYGLDLKEPGTFRWK